MKPNSRKCKLEGFSCELTKDITNLLDFTAAEYEPEVKLNDIIMLRAMNTNIVFCNSIVKLIYYQTQDENGEIFRKEYALPQLKNNDRCLITYYVENIKHSYINICDKAFNGKTWYDFKWSMEKEYFVGKSALNFYKYRL